MLDICFSDTFGGLLLMARKLLGSNILPLNLHLNYGHLSGNVIANQERLLADNLKCYYPNITPREIARRYRKNLRQAQKCYNRLEKRIKKGEPLRLWINNTARDLCNLYWLCHFTKPFLPKISVVTCPGHEHDVPKNDWAMFDDYHFVAACSKNAKQLTEEEICNYSNIWNELVAKDATLRILVNNCIVSSTEDHFDTFILQHIDYTPKRQSRVIGELLVENEEMNYDFWMSRIDYLIKIGRIIITKNDVDGYGCCCPRFIALTERTAE